MPPQLPDPDDELLRPREVAALFGVRPTTIARWARQGKLQPLRTPGGHRRYSRSGVQQILNEESTPEELAHQKMADDAVRLYQQGWSVRQVAARFDTSYGVMRRILRKRVSLRSRGGRPPTGFADE
jgi:excisionase family DNA binding protein